LIEGSEIFQMIEKDSQTDRQVIEETNYIMKELKDYRNLYAEANERCRECGGVLIFSSDLVNDRHYLSCYDCGKKDKR